MKNNHRQRVWLRLDNAAKIFPASLRPGWSNVFRLSVTLKEAVDPQILQQAVESLAPRFPSVYVALKRGLFWYYLEENALAPQTKKEGCQPLLPMGKKEIGTCAVRVLYYENRIAVEFFHALTDGTGALVFLKTLLAEYLRAAEKIAIPFTCGTLDPSVAPTREELEDSFLRYAGGYAAPRDTSRAYRLMGIPERDGFLHVTCFCLSSAQVVALAKKKGVTVTALLASVLTYALAQIQRETVARDREKPIRVQIPVNLRQKFPSTTLRNFVSVFSVGLEKGEGDADWEEVLYRVHHKMALENTTRNLRSVFTANVNSEKGWGIRLVPLFLKNLVMRAVYDTVGESATSLCISNLGSVLLPEEAAPFVEYLDFIIGTQAKSPYNCSVISYGDRLRMNVVRNTVKPELEKKIYEVLTLLGLTVTLESNER